MKQHLIAIGSLVLVLGSSGPAAAEEPKAPAAPKKAAVPPLDWKTQLRRQALFDEGRKLVEEEKWSEAREKFLEVHHLRSHPRVVLWLALCEEHLGSLLKARTLYTQAQEQAHEAKLADVEKDATDALAALKPKVPLVALHVARGIEAEVLIDDAKATLHDDCVEVDPGQHRVLVRAPGHRDYRVELTVAAGEEKTLNASLPEIPPPLPPPPPPVEDRGPAKGAIAFLAVGGALVGAGIPMTGVGASKGAKGLTGAGLAFLLGGAGGLAVGIPWAVSSTRAKPATGVTSLSVSAAPLPGGAAFGAHGTF